MLVVLTFFTVFDCLSRAFLAAPLASYMSWCFEDSEGGLGGLTVVTSGAVEEEEAPIFSAKHGGGRMFASRSKH